MPEQHEPIADGSDRAKAYCRWLEESADYLALEKFRNSKKKVIAKTQIFEFDDDPQTIESLIFEARKIFNEETGELEAIEYVIEASIGRVPEADALGNQPVMRANPEYRDEEDEGVYGVAVKWIVNNFLIDDRKLQPRREIIYQYDDESEKIIDCETMEGEYSELDGVSEEDFMLQLLDASTKGFSEDDQVSINEILKRLRIVTIEDV